jgi:hypothetical protein
MRVVIFLTVVYTNRLVAERERVCVCARASERERERRKSVSVSQLLSKREREREREREGFCSRKREEKRRNIFNTCRVFSGFCE